ncbi:MAG TPA: hypothetical protein VNL77_14325 [Roseiflexaceae bacterium]|nr:hypothetical protein [Roseiflexaceae bacterium]
MTTTWCLLVMALVTALAGAAVLFARMPRPDLTRVRPSQAIRGCIAALFLLAALALAGLTAAVALGGR